MYLKMWLNRFFLSKHRFIRFTPLISMISLTLAVASLALAMSVYSGYEQTVKNSIVDMTGHLVLTARNGKTTKNHLLQKIKSEESKIKSHTAFLSLNALLVSEGKLTGVIMEGLENNSIQKTLNLQSRLTSGRFNLEEKYSALTGTETAKRFRLKPGSSFYVVLPNVDEIGGFQTQHKSFYTTGVLDFGFYDFNSRYIITSLKTVQSLSKDSNLISGLRLKLKNPAEAEELKSLLVQLLGLDYKVSHWQNIIKNFHSSYFHAVQREKLLIFFILMILIIAGAFNVSSHISISVLNQFREISILKVLGGGNTFIFNLFLIQGLFISLAGAGLGLALGWLLSQGLIFLQKIIPILPQEVYKVNMIIAELRFSDIALIFICSQVICLLSCLLPCWRALKISLREGLTCE